MDWQLLDIPSKNETNKHTPVTTAKDNTMPCDGEDQPVRLPNGKWKCNHRCKDKTTWVLRSSMFVTDDTNSHQMQALLLP